ncbi:MAG: hypothetical protein EOM20_07830 [Spartobacteria bacterium]|nr:hypothetical protein [Spartobacteria bacterium]
MEAQDGSWWLFFLGTRPHWNWHHLGRETCLTPVAWDQDGWPVVGENGQVPETPDAPRLPAHAWAPEPVRDDFDAPTLRLCWNFLRNPRDGDWSLKERPGWLSLRGSDVSLSDVDSPAFVGRRQQHVDCRVETLVDCEPERDGAEAGLTALMNERHHYDIAVARIDGRKCVLVRRTIGTLSAITALKELAPGPARLWIKMDRETCYLGCGDEEVGRGEVRYLSKEVAGGFTGVYLGMYATNHARAAFDWFDYSP